MKYFEGDAELPFALGNLLLRKEKADLAQELFAYVLELEPTNALRLHGMASAYEAQGLRDKAVEALEKAIRLDPMVESSYRALATLHVRANRPDLAIEVWERYLALMPESIYAREAKAALQSQVSAPQ